MDRDPKKEMETGDPTPGSLMGNADADPALDDEIVLLEEGKEDSQETTQKKSSFRLGVALEVNRVTLSLVELSSERVRLVECVTSEVGGDSPAALTLALREALKKLPSYPRFVDLVLSPGSCEYQVLALPQMEESEKDTYLAQLASKSIGDREACFSVLPLSKTSISTDHLLVATPLETVEGIVRGFHRAGLVPERVLPPFAAALALFQFAKPKESGPTILVDHLYQKEVNFLIWDEGTVKVFRNIRKESGSDRWEEFLDSEVYRTVAFYRNSSGGKRVNKLHLVSPDDQSESAVQRFRAVGMFENGVEQVEIENWQDSENPLAPLAAAAAASSNLSYAGIDLLPRELRDPKRKQTLSLITLVLACILGLGELIGFYSIHQANEQKRETLKAASHLSETLSHHESAFRGVENKKRDFRKLVDRFDTIRRRRVPVSDTLVNILSVRPEKIILKGLDLQAHGNYGAYTVILYAEIRSRGAGSDDTDQLSDYVKKLESIPGASNVTKQFRGQGEAVPGANNVFKEEIEFRVTFPSQEVPE